MQETRVQSLDQEVAQEEEMATHSNILIGQTLWTEEPGSLPSIRSQRVKYGWAHARPATGAHDGRLLSGGWASGKAMGDFRAEAGP